MRRTVALLVILAGIILVPSVIDFFVPTDNWAFYLEVAFTLGALVLWGIVAGVYGKGSS